MKKLLALLLTLTLSLGLLAGCGQTEPTAEDTPDTQTETDTQNNTGDLRKITITEQVRGYHWAPAYLAQSLGYFAEEGLTAEYSAEVESKIRSTAMDAGFGGGERDAYFAQAGKFIIEKDKASIGMLQRMFKIGFNRAARIMDQLADAGVVGEEEGTKPRKVLMSMEQFENMMEEGY